MIAVVDIVNSRFVTESALDNTYKNCSVGEILSSFKYLEGDWNKLGNFE